LDGGNFNERSLGSFAKDHNMDKKSGKRCLEWDKAYVEVGLLQVAS